MSDVQRKYIAYPGPPAKGSYNLQDVAIDSNGVEWLCTLGGPASTTAKFVSPNSSPQTTVLFPIQATTVGAPAYVKGGIYFDTTLNKLRVGGATAWETITSA